MRSVAAEPPLLVLPVALAVALAVALCGVPSRPAHAQSGGADPRAMTVDELERFIEEQKAALEQVRENRDVTAEKAREVREALAEKEAELQRAETELETLCREREALEPGTFEDCIEQSGG